MIDLDRASLERVLPSTPGPADWDDVMSRFRSHRVGRRRRVVVLAAVALVAVVGTAAAVGSVRDFILDRGFICLPPEGATPSAPESGELVLKWVGRSATHARPHPDGFLFAPLVRAWVHADGRIIWSREGSVPAGANKLTSGYLEQRLTPEGVELLRSEVVELLDRSRTPLETLPADQDLRPGPFSGLLLVLPRGSGCPWCHGALEVRDGDRLLRLQWESIEFEDGSKSIRGSFGDRFERNEVTIARPEQLSVLRRVDALVTDPASVLPSEAWAVREIRAYVPSHYAVCIGTSPPQDASQLLSLLPARSTDVLRGKSLSRSEGDVVEARERGRIVVLGRAVSYCAKLTTEEAREVAEPLSGFDPDPRFHQNQTALSYQLAEAQAVDNLGPTTISFDPYLPHGRTSCFACG